MIIRFRTDKEHSDQGRHCFPFSLHHLAALMYSKILNIVQILGCLHQFLGCRNFSDLIHYLATVKICTCNAVDPMNIICKKILQILFTDGVKVGLLKRSQVIRI